MLKKLVLLLAAFVLTMSVAFAASVEVNTADQATLETLKGIGPVKSKAIVDERTKNGPFKDAGDLARRVKGLGTKSVATLQGEGLTIGGSSAPPANAGAKHEKASASATPATSQPPAKHTQPAPQAAAMQSSAPAAAAAASSASPQTSKANKKKKGKSRAASAASAASGM
ncbi:helix-hairpin-helix domain-containing protein [Trinickia sp. NRRL B-1857]|uniref:ComEA family DNA-binding protein n=1 Tax=Trinickia sp. NRRL B-1857 TaxID=3162879 RepID=UPI003D29CDE8